MKTNHLANNHLVLSRPEDIKPGVQRIRLDINVLYTDLNDRARFEARLNEFLKIDTTSKIMDYSDGVLTYLTESVIPTRQDSRSPLLLLFGNPAPDSILNKCFFAGEKGKDRHRFWPTLEKSKIISFLKMEGNNNINRTKALFDLNYNSLFRLGLAVFFSMPSPASDQKWSGVAGLRRLFGTRAFKQIAESEELRINGLIKDFVAVNPNGAVVAFQKDAYLGVKNADSPERVLYEKKQWQLIESRCSFNDVRLFRIPPTRYMVAPWYLDMLKELVKLRSIKYIY
jgi:hypothetical protein